MDSYVGVSLLEPLTVDECFENCQKTLNCNFFAFWPPAKQPYSTPKGLCVLYTDCPRTNCSSYSFDCQTGTVYKMEAIGVYQNLRTNISTPQLIYPRRGVQTTWYECFNCLRLYPEPDCVFHCGEPVQVTFQHYPGGQACGTCMFAGNYVHELNSNEYGLVKECVYTSIAAGMDPWTSCQPEVQRQGEASNSHQITQALDLFNGVSTHFLTECPGREFGMFGALCAPNVYAREFFTTFVLHHKGSKDNAVWPLERFDCLNAICELVSRDQCYSKLAVYDFEATGTVLDQVGNLHLLPTGNPQIVKGEGLIFNKTKRDSFLVTPFLKKNDMEDVTLEVWATIPPSEGVTDVARNRYRNSTAESGWFEIFDGSKALDQDLSTYWTSEMFDSPLAMVTYEVDFGRVVWSEGWRIHWFHRAQAYTMWTADEGYHGEKLEYVRLNNVIENTDYLNDFSSTVDGSFFRGRWMKLIVTRMKDSRTIEGFPIPFFCVSVKELEVLSDRNLARLHPTNQTMSTDYRPSYVIDGDEQTFWSSPPGISTAVVMLELTETVTNFAYTRLSWNHKPTFYTLIAFDFTCDRYLGQTPPAGATYTTNNVQTVMSKTSDLLDLNPDIFYEKYDARCIIVEASLTVNFNDFQVQLREMRALPYDPVEIRTNVTISSNLPEATYDFVQRTLDMAFDADDSTYFYTSELGPVIWNLNGTKELFRIVVSWPVVDSKSVHPRGVRISYAEDDFQDWQHVYSTSGQDSADAVIVLPTPVIASYVRVHALTFNSFSPDNWGIKDVFLYHPAAVSVAKVYTKPLPNAPLEYTAAFFDNVFETYPYYNQGSQPYAQMNVDPLMPLNEEDLYSGMRAIDGDHFSYTLSTLGKEYVGGDNTWILTVEFAENAFVDVVALEWRFRPSTVQIQCGNAFGSYDVIKTHLVVDYVEYLRDWPNSDGNAAVCSSIRVLCSGLTEMLGDHALMGIAEVRVYSYGEQQPLQGIVSFTPSAIATPLTTDSGRSDLIANSNDLGFIASDDLPTPQPVWYMKIGKFHTLC